VLPALSILALLMGLASIPVGIWLLKASRLPAWMKGIWKWPLGDNVTPPVIHLQGWAGVLVGAAALIASILILLPHQTVLIAGMIAMFLVGASAFAWAWSVQLSHKAPA
jgi:hypothetical protein